MPHKYSANSDIFSTRVERTKSNSKTTQVALVDACFSPPAVYFPFQVLSLHGHVNNNSAPTFTWSPGHICVAFYLFHKSIRCHGCHLSTSHNTKIKPQSKPLEYGTHPIFVKPRHHHLSGCLISRQY